MCEDPNEASLIARVSERFLSYIHDLEANRAIIDNLEAGAHAMMEQARVLRGNLDRMAGDIGKIQADFDLDRPIAPYVDAASSSPSPPPVGARGATGGGDTLDWTCETGQEILVHIQNWYNAHNGKKGYPKYKDIHRVLRRESLSWLESATGSGEEAFQRGVNECKKATRKRRRQEAKAVEA